MPYEAVPEPGDMSRLALLDACCDVHMFSMLINGARLWTVVVRPTEGEDRFERTDSSLKLAVRAALAEAEARGLIPATSAPAVSSPPPAADGEQHGGASGG